MAIFTDAKCRPFERPEKPAPGADIETVVAYMRAMNDYRDVITACANRAFDKALRKELSDE